MDAIETILQRYEEGDAEERMGLFLAYRDLRNQFVALETQCRNKKASRSDGNAPPARR